MMSDQSFNFIMHTLNKYGVPCTDVTDYPSRESASSISAGGSGTFYLQKSAYSSYLITTKLKSLGTPLDPIDPITGIPGYCYCNFHNEPDGEFGSKGYCDYYSLGSGSLMATIELPYMVSVSSYRMFPSVDINSNKGVYDALEYEGQYPNYMRFDIDSGGEWTPKGQVLMQRNFARNSVTYVGESGVSGESSYIGYSGSLFAFNPNAVLPARWVNNYIYTNEYGEDAQLGVLWKEALPDLTPDVPLNQLSNKRVALSKQNLFVGDLAPGPGKTIQVTFGSTLDINNYPDRDNYSFLVDVFDDHFDDGSGKYTIGSGQIQGLYYNNTLFIMLSFDDIRGGQGNQAYQKWYDAGGHFLYNWIYPSYIDGDDVEQLYWMTGRVNHQTSFFYVGYREDNNESYLFHYNLFTGGSSQIHLENPYKDEQYEGPYKISNQQLIANKYLMVHTSPGHCIFFDAYTPSAGIQAEVRINSTSSQLSQLGYYVIPSIGDDQPESPITNTLLQLCNNIRYLKMYWAVNQVQVCKDHANWCTSRGLFQHEGPVAGEDGPTSLRRRNNVAGISAGLSENITIVMESNSDQEQTEAFAHWCDSPHHLEGIIRAGNKYMSWACSTYPYSVTSIIVGPGMYDGQGGYTTEETIREVQEYERGKLKLYVQNFIWY
jgi:hypothetical protein